MEVTVRLDEEIVEKIVATHNARVVNETNQITKKRMMSWSTRELVICHLQVLARMYHEGQLKGR